MRWQAGLVLSVSRGEGGYRSPSADGEVSSTLTALHPWAGLDVSERLSVWAATGYGSGELELRPGETGDGEPGEVMETDLSYRMGAAGAVSELLEPGRADGARLALKTDARFTRTSSDATEGMAGAQADVWQVRLGLEGSRRFALGEDGAGFVPSFEVGVRRDGGDAETGFGADVGGGLAVQAGGLVADLSARGLLAHEASGFREWGASAAFGYDPDPASPLGFTASLHQSWGASASGGADALLARTTMAGLDGEEDGGFEAVSRLEATLGYAMAAFGGRGVATPHLGWSQAGESRTLHLGQRLELGASRWTLASELGREDRAFRASYGYRPRDFLDLSLEATRREAASDGAPRHGIALRLNARW